VKLQQAPYAIARRHHYALHFRARADAARTIGCAVGQITAPWNLLSKYAEFRLDSEWRTGELAFVAQASESKARIFCDLAAATSAVEFAAARLADLTTGQDVRLAPKPEQFFISYRFNRFGFRGPDYVIPRPANIFRIVALGDPYTQGVGVHERDTFAVQLEQRLNEDAATRRLAVKYEVLNASVSGYATLEERLTYELVASEYEPQVVLLLMVFNDDLSFEQEVEAGLVGTIQPGRAPVEPPEPCRSCCDERGVSSTTVSR
jgi:hypothetical protein